MKTLSWSLAAVCGFAVLAGQPKPAGANDTLVGESAGGFVVLTDHPLRMVNEHIVADSTDGQTFHVQATYTFENPTDRVQSVTMAFPERAQCRPAEVDFYPGFNDLTVMADDVVVETRLHTITLSADDPTVEGGPRESACDVPAHLFDVRFEPHAQIVVTHAYNVESTRDTEFTMFRYVTRTGAFWNGPIEDARFDVTLRNDPTDPVLGPAWVQGREFRDVTITDRLENGQMVRTWSFRQENWTPVGDLSLAWQHQLATGDCSRYAWSEHEWLVNDRGIWRFRQPAASEMALEAPERLRAVIIDAWRSHGFDSPIHRVRRLWPSFAEWELLPYGYDRDIPWSLLPAVGTTYLTPLFPEERECVASAWQALLAR